MMNPSYVEGRAHYSILWFVLLAGMLMGCRTVSTAGRPFRFPTDALAVTNETAWIYGVNPVTGTPVHAPRTPAPTYALHCFVLARTAKQFHAHAEFRPSAARRAESTYRDRLRAVVARSPRSWSPVGDRIEFPGFTDLHEFSAAYPELIRRYAGRAWRSYLQRGNWRMILPFTRGGQRAEAKRLVAAVESGRAPIVHVSEFPRLRINHALLLYDVKDTPEGLRFSSYDPNNPNVPVIITFHPDEGFRMPPVPYYLGGAVRVYEVYRSWSR